MEEKIKEIVATFIRVPADQIGPATPIDRRAVKSSIMLHRMYAKLAEAGLVVTDYTSMKIFGDLNGRAAAATAPEINHVQEAAPSPTPAVPYAEAPAPTPAIPHAEPPAPANNESLSMGIDIESVASLPQVTDFRRDEFYKQNFTPREMAWCILQAQPYESFAGLFAAKEALIKADNTLKDKPFNQIAIGRSPQGKPLYPGFTLSIAHSNGTAVAVAARTANNGAPAQLTFTQAPEKAKTGRAIVWLALALAAAALILSLWRAK